MAAGVPIPFTITVGAIPPGVYTDQQLLNTLESVLQISLAEGVAFFSIGGAQPTSNTGPWLKNGVSWYVWSDALGTYVPATIPQTSLGYIVSMTAPDPTVYQVWFQIDSGNNPVGIFSYNAGASPPAWEAYGYSQSQINAFFSGIGTDGKQQVAWADILGAPFGSTIYGNTAVQNALTPGPYQQFFNTDINALLVYYSGGWHTVDGVPGDVKYASASSLATALTNNPGWTQNANAIARVLISAGDGTPQSLNIYTNGQQGGQQSVTLSAAQLPAIIPLTVSNFNGYAGSGADNALNDGSNPITINFPNADPSGGGQPTPTLPPFVAYWCLIKS